MLHQTTTSESYMQAETASSTRIIWWFSMLLSDTVLSFTVSSLFYPWGILCCMGSTTAGWIFMQLVINMSRATGAQIRANMFCKTDEKSMRPTTWVSLAFMTYHAYLPLVTQLFCIVLSCTIIICVQEMLDFFLTCLSLRWSNRIYSLAEIHTCINYCLSPGNS